MAMWKAEITNSLMQGQAAEMLFLARKTLINETEIVTRFEMSKMTENGDFPMPEGGPLFSVMSWDDRSELDNFLQALMDVGWKRGIRPSASAAAR